MGRPDCSHSPVDCETSEAKGVRFVVEAKLSERSFEQTRSAGPAPLDCSTWEVDWFQHRLMVFRIDDACLWVSFPSWVCRWGEVVAQDHSWG